MSSDVRRRASMLEMLIPLLFILAGGWCIWHLPAYILDFFPPENPSLVDQLTAQFKRNDVTPAMSPLFGGIADPIDWLALLALPVLLGIGMMTVRRAPMEYEDMAAHDRLSVFISRVSMVLIALLVCVMITEVVLRYVFETPTLWANELSLWMAGFVFLLAGLYAMQQRSHIRIFLLYDVMPRWVQRVFDTISTLLIIVFAIALIYGGFGESWAKFLRWETFGTAFDPPIPATLKPLVLIAVTLVALQAVLNLIRDWNKEPEVHTAADDIDQDELERLRKAVGVEGTGELDVTRGPLQNSRND